MEVAKLIMDSFKRFDTKPALQGTGKRYSYRELLEAVTENVHELKAKGIMSGDVVVIEGETVPIYVLLVGLLTMGTIVMPLASFTDREKKKLLKSTKPSHSVTWRNGRYRIAVWPGGSDTHPLVQQLLDNHSSGIIVFSSGSSGQPKAILHDFGRLADKFIKKRGRSYRTLSLLRFDHLGGLNTLFYTLFNGGTLVLVPDRRPITICEAIQKERIELLPATPSFLNLLLLSGVWRRYDLSSLKVISYGTEVMPEKLLHRLRDSFPDTEFRQTYGLSELGVLPVKQGKCLPLWMSFDENEVQSKVVRGTLWIRSPYAMLGYLNDSQPFRENGWMDTGDIVSIKGNYVRVLGRKSDIINVAGHKVFPAEVERIISQVKNIKEVCVYGEHNPLLGNIVAARVTLIQQEPYEAVREHIRQCCLKHLSRYKIPMRIRVQAGELNGTRMKKKRRTFESVRGV